MASYDFDALTDHQSLKFIPTQDTLVFGAGDWGAADLDWVPNGQSLWLVAPGKTILLRGMKLAKLSSAHFVFADGGKLLVGDDSTDTAQDGAANLLTGTGHGDYLEGLGGKDSLYGGGGVDRLSGGTGSDLLDGGAGADFMLGGAGNDTYTVDDPGDVVVEATDEGTDTVLSGIGYTLGDNIERLALLGGANLDGYGNALDNRVTGNAGDNALAGGEGNDSLYGGAGRDTLSGDAGGDILNGGCDDDSLNGGDGWDALYGGNGQDVLNGGAGSDLLDGGKGRDFMSGGPDNDIYAVDNVQDQVIEYPGGGSDMVVSTVAYTLPPNIENLVLLGGDNLVGFGNALANQITGNAGDNTLDGGGGADTLIGGAGNDTLIVTGQNFALADGGEGVDTLVLGGRGLALNLGSVMAGGVVRGIEAIDLGGTHVVSAATADRYAAIGNTLSLNQQDVLNLSPDGDPLRIDGAAGDHVQFADAGWVQGADVVLVGVAYHSFDNGSAHILINPAL